jgi:diaminopimelate epimerase
MAYSFSKYSGCGNDFILIDNRDHIITRNHNHIALELCHRQNGIGADGLILLENSSSCDFKMRIFNSDGSEAEMCGNGIRCLAKFIQKLGIPGSTFSIETMLRNLNVYSGLNDEEVCVDMGNPTDIRWNLPIHSFMMHHLDTGVPHAVTFVSDLESINVNEIGPTIRHHTDFQPRGANANFAVIDKDKVIHVRTFERGVEQETLACGTGVTATALAAAKSYQIASPITVKVRSHDLLKVHFKRLDDRFFDVRLSGPARHVFDGIYRSSCKT